ncbi:MAG: hypothetical protein HY730_05620 [Candidatus Tectomicrobia bacterium]|uniref:Uncharacterized protein n=1 Tax=Tectimicrobiota bacterium TaxID=2528274 RepID=A0A933LQ61_UNCTE|nr:hypothetical protein [Candidatus Tectomicrobia bacterium]
MDYKTFLSEVIKKEMEMMGQEKVKPILDKCLIITDPQGNVLSTYGMDNIAITQKLVRELCNVNPLAKIPARALSLIYRKYDPAFELKL